MKIYIIIIVIIITLGILFVPLMICKNIAGKINVGMTGDEVVNILGRPSFVGQYTDNNGGGEMVYYEKWTYIVVIAFKNKVVNEIGLKGMWSGKTTVLKR